MPSFSDLAFLCRMLIYTNVSISLPFMLHSCSLLAFFQWPGPCYETPKSFWLFYPLRMCGDRPRRVGAYETQIKALHWFTASSLKLKTFMHFKKGKSILMKMYTGWEISLQCSDNKKWRCIKAVVFCWINRQGKHHKGKQFGYVASSSKLMPRCVNLPKSLCVIDSSRE